jgi:hypothetical protein
MKRGSDEGGIGLSDEAHWRAVGYVAGAKEIWEVRDDTMMTRSAKRRVVIAQRQGKTKRKGVVQGGAHSARFGRVVTGATSYQDLPPIAGGALGR